MAKQAGIIKLKGTIDNISFYKSQDGHLARAKGGADKNKILKDPTFARTNRILDEIKSQGNVVAFRNLKEATDEARTLFSNKEAIEEIIVQPYEDYIGSFDDAVARVKAIAPTFEAVNDLVSEEEELEFVKAFR